MRNFFKLLLTTIFLIAGNVIPAFAASNVTIDLKTNSDKYAPGSIIYVTGKVLKDGEAGKGTSPTMVLSDPNGNPITFDQWNDTEVSNDGSISGTITLPNSAELGAYLLKLSAAGVSSTKTIQVISKVAITVSTDKTSYYKGNRVTISGDVTSSGAPVASQDVMLTVTKDGLGLAVDQVKTTLDGKYTATFQVDSKFRIGTYTINVTSLKESSSVTFKVEEEIVVVPPGPGPSPTPTPSPEIPATPQVNQVSDTSTSVTGTAGIGVTVVVKTGGVTLGSSTVGSNGKFSIPIKAQKAGTILEVTAVDSAGNASKPTTFTVLDKTAPAAPTVNIVTASDKKVSGIAEPGSTVSVYVGKSKLGSAVADKKGYFSISIKAQKVGTGLTVLTADKAKNISKTTKVVVKKAVPSTPSVNTIKASSTKVTGKADPGLKVIVKTASKQLGSATSDKYGNYSIKISKQKAGSVLYVYAVYTNGKGSNSRKIIVMK